MPVETLLAESDGVPLRIHRAAGEWARAEAAERLAATAGRAADDRERAARDPGRGRRRRGRPSGRRASAPASTRSQSRPIPRRPRSARSAAWRPSTPRTPSTSSAASAWSPSSSPAWSARPCSRWSAPRAAASPRPCAPAFCRRWPDGVVPGSEHWRRAVMRPGERPLAELSRALARAVPEAGREDAAPWIADALDRLRARRAPRALRRSVRGGLRRLSRRGRAGGVLRRAGRGRRRPRRAAGRRARDPRRLLRALRRARRALDAGRAPTRSWSGRCAATSCAARSSCRRARPGCGSSRGWSRRWSATSPTSPAACRCSRPPCSSSGSGATAAPCATQVYERSGGVSGAVARLAEDAYQRLSPAERLRARPMLLRLAGADDEEAEAFVRRRVSLDELELERDQDAARALAVLTESRLLTVDEGAVEVAHEALLREWPRLRGWLEEDAEGRRLHQHLIGAAARVARLRARSRRALSRRPARRGARLGRRARPRAQRARARVPRREPGRERARGRAPAARQPPPADAARRGRRAARRRRRRRGDRALRAPGRAQRGHRRRRPAPRRPGPHRGPPRPGAAARQRRRRPRRLGRDPLQPALDAASQPRGARRPQPAGDGALRRSRSAPTAARSRSATQTAP